MKTLFIVLALTAFMSAHAATMTCVRIKGDRWTLTGELGGSSLNLWDNNKNSTFKLTGVAEKLPPVYHYAEEGNSGNLITLTPSRDKSRAQAFYTEKGKPWNKMTFNCKMD